tara:strand:+ start:1381 stop:2211 length:831 start_codon:yes stop_codon:yes gene_type:complete
MKKQEPLYTPDANWVSKKDIKLFVATPVHSEVSIHYMQSVFKLQAECNEKQIPIMLQLMKSSLITQGRNLCVAEFLNTDFTHMLFIDSDIQFNTESIFKMLSKDQDLLSIPYPMKNIQWDKVLNKWKDIPDMNYTQISTAGNKYPVRLKDREDDINCVNEMIELSHSMTGCMLIKREVLKKMITAYPELTIKQETVVDGKTIVKPNLYNFFDTYYDTVTKIYYGEDFAFSRLWTKIGGKCMALITEYITHVGEYQYSGRLIDEMITVGLDKPEKNS